MMIIYKYAKEKNKAFLNKIFKCALQITESRANFSE